MSLSSQCVSRFLLLLAAGVSLCGQQSFIPTVLNTPGTPSELLYGTINGNLVKSTNLGRTWTPIYVTEPGSAQPPVVALEIDPLDERILYLATTRAGGHMWRSNDRGETWTQAANGLPTLGGVSLDYFKVTRVDAAVFMYVKIGQQLFKSTDRGNVWGLRGVLPSANGIVDFSPVIWSRGYFVNRDTLEVYTTIEEGHSWVQKPRLIQPPFGDLHANALTVVPYDADSLFVSVMGTVEGIGAYRSSDTAATFTPLEGTGLGPFAKFYAGATGPLYATMLNGPGFFRSTDNAATWTSIGTSAINSFTLDAVDPSNRGIVYGRRAGDVNSLVRSIDGGTSWQDIAATTTPTIAKPLAAMRISVIEGAPYQQVFNVRALENAAWPLAVTINTSGQPWMELTTTAGTTPTTTALRINSTGLAPGTYTGSITVNAPQSFNKTVSFPVELTVRPLGSIPRRHFVSTVVGNGSANETRTVGPALELSIGAPRALRFDADGRLWISAGNRLWRKVDDTLTAVAGTGIKGSSGDGLNALDAQISDPEGLDFDLQSRVYFSEFESRRVRRIANDTLLTQVRLDQYNFLTGSHGIVVNAQGQSQLATPQGILVFDGLQVRVRTPFAFGDPFGMVADGEGNLYVSDRQRHQIFRVPLEGPPTLFAGNGTASFTGDGGAAIDAGFNAPAGLAFGPDGRLYIADAGNQRIRVIGLDGVVTTIAGSGLTGFAGDNDIADFAAFSTPLAVAVDAAGRVFVADSGNNRVRMLEEKAVVPPPPPPPVPTAVGKGGSSGGTLSPGGLFSLYGTLLAGTTVTNQAIPWPLNLANVRITINGFAAPLYYVSPTQINGQVPYEVQPGTATLVITYEDRSGNITFPVVPASPGILVYNGNRGVIVNPNGSVNAANAPARPGDVVVAYLSGIGVPTPTVATGQAAPLAPLSHVNYTYSIRVGNATATSYFLGQTPGYPSLAQANFAIPNLPPGDYDVALTVNGVASDPVRITVGP